jgi:hypothetical protein
MSFLTDVSAAAASRLMSVIAVGALTTAAAGAGAAFLLTGSANPSAWVAAYQHSRECARPAAAQDPNCSTAAARALVEARIALQLEQQAKKLDAIPPPAPTPPPPQVLAPAAAPAPVRPAAVVAPPAHSDDSGEGVDG